MRMSPTSFAEYARVVAEHFCGASHTISRWGNEPQCSVGLGFMPPTHAPGFIKLDEARFSAHGTIQFTRIVSRGSAGRPGGAWWALPPTGRICTPATDSPADIAAARQAMFDLEDGNWTFTYSPALDPIVLGKVAANQAGGQAQRVIDAIPQEQLDALPLGRLDFIGMNIYNSVAVRARADGKPEFRPRAAGHPRTAIGWPITPEAMEWGPRFPP